MSKASALGLAAGIAIDHGDLDRALALAEQSLEMARLAGDETNVGWMLLGVARARILRGDLVEAEATTQAAFEILLRTGEPVGLSWARALRARLLLAAGDDDGVQAMCEEILAMGEQASAQARSEALVLRGLCERTTGSASTARALCDEGIALARTLMPVHLQFLLLHVAAIHLAIDGDHDHGRQRLLEVFQLAREVRAVQFLPNALRTAAIVANNQCRPGDVARLVGAADRLRDDTGVRVELRPLALALDDVLEQARRSLGDAEYERRHAEGRAIGLAGAVDLALDVLSPSR